MPADAFVGDTVFHKSFGTGIVTEADENKIAVEFESVGKKTFVNPDAFIDGFLYKPYSA
jgi:transcription elongation factor GreA-like protein